MEESKDFEMYAVGLVCASICTSLPIETAVERANIERPTGIQSNWALSEDKTFADGKPNPLACELKPKTHKHYLLNC